ncbi:MAG TPA: arginine--tRNA ligase [Verrucomicrobiae bacterium]|nr:arginine--tRNA ligase [Verrucomicrobiae bacterium]
MQYILDAVLTEITEKVQQLLNVSTKPIIGPARAEFKADYGLPCFPFARELKKSPQAIAQQVAEGLQHESIQKIEAVGGFVNFTLQPQVLASSIDEVTRLEGRYGEQSHYQGQVQVIETNNPNPFKDMHIGHAYNSIVADTIANLLELGGGDVHRVSYHGDVGLHVGKSMWAILKYAEGDITKLEAIVPAERASFLSKMYVEGAGAYEEDPLEKQQIELLAKQSFILDDPFYQQVYEMCKQWSFDYLDEIIATIGSKHVEKRYLERQADELGRKIVEAHDEVFEKSEGATIFPGEKYDLHTRVFISSRGTTLYEARDLGLMQLKNQDFNPDMSYIVTAEEQREYFRVVFKAAELVLPELGGKTTNIPHGTVKLSTGKMSSRTGKVLNIEWIFNALRESILQRSPDTTALDETITGALRYAMLKVKIGGDIIFDINEAVSLEGNSGPYLQYAYARGRSILAKLSVAPATELGNITADEHQLIMKLLQYPSVTTKAVAELAPHLICTYLYELTQQFNRFYEANRIIGHEREAERAYMVNAYTLILQNSLGVLGIPSPERL